MRSAQILLLLLALPASAQTMRVQGLHKPVNVIRDRWGVPHIYATDQHDLFFAQGFVQAQDRLYQMEIWKRAGQGRLAEVLGPAFLKRDIAARKLRYRGSMEKEYASYGADSKAILTAFTSGINARIASIGKEKLPSEFRLAGFAPEMWKPEDCLQRMAAYGLMSNAEAELRNTKLVSVLGVEKTTLLLDPQPSVDLDPVPGLDTSGLGPEMLDAFVGSDLRVDAQPLAAGTTNGSNNWTVSGMLTASGKPILANDPHRTIAIPSLRYIVHLVAPGWDVIGAVEPALPGVAIGHNRSIAWGITIFPVDQQDLYVETLRPEHPRQYKTENGWKEMRVEHERIAVKGGPAVDTDVELTRHGPVIWRDATRVVALKWAGAEPGTAGYLGSLALDRASNWTEFLSALRRWKVPAENIVYADRTGTIGEQSIGLTPRRSWTGLLPVDGSTGMFEWKGWIDLDQLPRSLNPKEGFIATANHRIVDPEERRNLSYAWASPYRIDRIREVLGQWRDSGHKMTLTDMGTLQNDVTSGVAHAMIAMLRDTNPAASNDAARILLAWDGRLTTDSSAAVLYEVWLRHLRTDSLGHEVRPDLHALAERALPLPTLLNRIAGQLTEARNHLLTITLHDAFAETQKRFGDDPAQWRWGSIHLARFRHGVSDRTFDRGPVERGGDSDTVNATGARGSSFEQAHGASFREILDTADWDQSLAINVPGQSGTPGSPHYDDLLRLWTRGEYFPLLYSRAAIEKESESTLTLTPFANK